MTVTTDDLGTYLNDDELNVARAQMMIDDATELCATVVSPLPSAADVVVKRVAARGYVETTSARQYQLGEADASFGAAPGPVGGVYLTKSDVRDLRLLAGQTGGGAFTIDTLSPTYAVQVPWWGDGATGYTDPSWDSYP